MNSIDLWIVEQRNSIELFGNTQEIYVKILNNYVNLGTEDIIYNSYGKPGLDKKFNLFFSTSHTDNLLLVAVTRMCEVGVDVESSSRIIKNLHLTA